jgi:serine/threonine-protein kinase
VCAVVVRPTQHTSPPVTELGHLRCCTTCNATFRTDFERCPLDGGTVIVTESDPLIGSTVGGHYEIEALIGIGAMGRVYRAHHTRLVKKRYALKVLFGEMTASATMRMRFAHEAESASKLEHPNVVGVLDFGCTDAGLMYLVMDLVEGPTLGALVDQGPMQPSRVVDFARQLCAGLGHAHARGIVHRDFKPDNILVSGDAGTAILRIADFGLAISVSKDDDDDARLTATGVLCTPTYAAPEQLLGKDIDHRADLYALGVTMYEMLTGGVLPFARGSQEVMLWKVTTEWPAVSTRAPKVPGALADLVRRLLAREPTGRPSSAGDVLEILERIAALPQRGSAKLRRIRHTHAIAGLGATALALGAVVIVRNVGGKAPSPTRMSAADVVAMQASEEQLRAELSPATSHEPVVPEPPPEEGRATEETPPAPLPKNRPAARAIAPPMRTKPPPVRPAQVIVEPAVVLGEPSPPPTVVREPVRDEPRETPAATPSPAPPKAPPATTPPPRPPAPVRVMRVAPPAAVAKARPPRIVGLDVSGALAPSVVRRGIERALPALEPCIDKVGARVVTIGFAVEELRRARHVRVSGPGADCIAAALGTIRVDAAPDVGDVTVELKLSFTDTP